MCRVACRALVVAVVAVAAALAGGRGPARAAEPPMKYVWVYAPCNFQVDEGVDKLMALMRRAKAAGYNGLLVTDYKFGRIQDRPANYHANLERTRRAADEAGMDLVPAVMPVGYSNSLLINNPNLAEGIAVRDCPFVVRGREAVPADAADLVPGGDFEQARDHKFAGWDWMDGPGKSVFQDTEVKHSGRSAARLQDFRLGNEYGNCRLQKKLALAPWRQYHVSLWLKTEGLDRAGDLRVAVLAPGGRSLNYTDLRAKPTQDWTQHHAVFNTLEHAEVLLYVGLWGGNRGRIWIDDLRVRPAAGVNLLRREGCPVRVTSEDGATEYVEGRDFETWAYPKMGRVPWAGSYEIYHPEPPIRLREGSRLRDGDRLRVSYYHTVIVYDDQVCGCLRHEETFRHMEEQARLLQRYLGPKRYMMSHDEIRVAGQCGLCRQDGVTAGQVLAENVRRCAAILRRVSPDAAIFVWSDMFDPHHNAVDRYYLVASSLAGAWEGLDPAVRVMNWNFGKRDASLAFFAQRGHKQVLAAYYDAADPKAQLEAWLQAAAKVPGVEGVMYTTWRNDYAALETFAEVLRAAAPAR